jgi:ABC-type glycerol-3-phosphate transport system substrate-binding protein
MSKSLKRNSFLGALIAAAVSVGVLTAPAKAAEQVTLTIWTFGDRKPIISKYNKL